MKITHTVYNNNNYNWQLYGFGYLEHILFKVSNMAKYGL
jgi:hypothetical protein